MLSVMRCEEGMHVFPTLSNSLDSLSREASRSASSFSCSASSFLRSLSGVAILYDVPGDSVGSYFRLNDMSMWSGRLLVASVKASFGEGGKAKISPRFGM